MASAEARKCWARFVSEYSDALCRLGEVLLAFSSGVLTFVTFGTAFWLEESYGDGASATLQRRHSGLWQNCTVKPVTEDGCRAISLSGPSTCGRLRPKNIVGVTYEIIICTGYLLAARFFMCIALVGGVAAWIISILGLLQHRARWLLIAAICYGVQGVFVCVCVCVCVCTCVLFYECS